MNEDARRSAVAPPDHGACVLQRADPRQVLRETQVNEVVDRDHGRAARQPREHVVRCVIQLDVGARRRKR